MPGVARGRRSGLPSEALVELVLRCRWGVGAAIVLGNGFLARRGDGRRRARPLPPLAAIQSEVRSRRFDADDVRGRRMKTWVRVRQDGTGVIVTVARGKSAMHWIARLKGGKPLRVVDR